MSLENMMRKEPGMKDPILCDAQGLSFPICKMGVGRDLNYSAPKDLTALTFPMSATVGKSRRQKEFQKLPSGPPS